MSLSREFAAFVAGLKYEDLPPAVIDRAKGVTLGRCRPRSSRMPCRGDFRRWR